MRKNTLKYAASLVTGILLTGPVGVMIGFGIDSLAICLCVEHGDDEEAVIRTIGVIAGFGIGATAKYADEVADLSDDVLGSVYKNSLDDVSDFKGFNLDENSVFFKNADDVTRDVNFKSGSKAISYTDYDNIYQSSIHNAGKEKVMLGKYDGGGPTSYITKAGEDYTYFCLGDEWNTIKAKYRYTDDDMFKLFNEAFLDDGINAEITFQFSHNLIGDKGALGMEYQYLRQNNYMWDEITMTMSPLR